MHDGRSYVRNRPLVFTDPSGFTEEEAWRLWRADETGPLGIHITYDKLTPPGPCPHFEPRAPAPPSTAEAAPSTADSIPPLVVTPGEQFVIGVGERAQEFGAELWLGIVGATPPDPRDEEIVNALVQGKPIPSSKEGGDALDQLNKDNPLYTGAISVIQTGEAYERKNYVELGRSSLGIFTTVVLAIVAKKAAGKAGAKTKAKATDHHVMTNKNYVSGTQGGPWSPIFEDMAARAGMKLNDIENRVRIPGHRGPHPRAYHEMVFKRLSDATDGLSGDAFANEFRNELARLRAEAMTPGSNLNRLLTGD